MKYAVSSEIAISVLFFFSSFSLSFFYLSQSYSTFSHNLTISLHLPCISNTFRTYSFYRMSLSRWVIDSKITWRIVEDFLSWFLTNFIYFPFLRSFLSLIPAFSLILAFSLVLSVSRDTLSRSFTLHDLLRSLYLTMIYLHVTYTSTSQLVRSPLA